MFFILKIIPKLLNDKEKIIVPKIKKTNKFLITNGAFLIDLKKLFLKILIVKINSNKFSKEEIIENKTIIIKKKRSI